MLGGEQVPFMERESTVLSGNLEDMDHSQTNARISFHSEESRKLKHYPEGLAENIPSLVAKREYSVLRALDPEKRNLRDVVYEITPNKIRRYRAYAHTLHAGTPTTYDTWGDVSGRP